MSLKSTSVVSILIRNQSQLYQKLSNKLTASLSNLKHQIASLHNTRHIYTHVHKLTLMVSPTGLRGYADNEREVSIILPDESAFLVYATGITG